MAFLTIAAQEIPVQLDEAAERPSERIGAVGRSFTGGFLTQVRAEKRTWAFVSAPMTRVEYEQLRANTSFATVVTCGGDALPAPTNCVVEIGDAKMIEGAAAEVLFLVAIVLRED